MAMLSIQSLRTLYGPVEALRGIDLEIRQGEIVSLIGNNGAGKSTCLSTISGITAPAGGSVLLNSRRLNGLPPHEIVGLGISQVPEGRRIFPRLTVKENLEMGAFLRGKDIASSLDHVFGLFPILHERQKQTGGTLSGGEQQMLAIARALMARPKLLLLDEPSLGLAPIMVSKIFRTIEEINREGVTILLVEQNARAALNLSHRGYVLENGTISLHGPSRDLLNDDKVRHAYLGQ